MEVRVRILREMRIKKIKPDENRLSNNSKLAP